MDTTFAYNLALFLHIGGVLALVAALALEGAALRGLRTALTADEARTWLSVLRPLRWLGPAALGLILVAGLYLAATIASPGGWIAVGLLGFLAIAALGGAVTGRRMRVVGPALGRARGQLRSTATSWRSEPPQRGARPRSPIDRHVGAGRTTGT